MSSLEQSDIQLGYIPLLDSIALLWAKHRDYFKDEGLNVSLVKEASWASLRDRLAYGILDAAHCLSAMLPAAALGVDQIGIPLQTSMVLSCNRAYISLSQQLSFNLKITAHDSAEMAATKIIESIAAGHSVRLAHVFKHSIHHYCLRQWVALADPQIAMHIEIATLPPPFMVEAIAAQSIDGFCVGEPWNTQAEIEGYAHIIAESQDIIPNITDKVLATTQEWAQKNPNTLKALQSAILRAQQDLATLDDLSPVWSLLKTYHIVRFECNDHVYVKAFHKIKNIIRDFGPQPAPHYDDFVWILEQMKLWDNVQVSSDYLKKIAQQCITKV